MSAEQEQADKEWAQTKKAFGTVLAVITPWLLELGSWVFGALIGFNLLVLAALLTVGPSDNAVLVATVGLALALPLDVAGLVLLRLVVDVTNVRLEDVTVKAFEEAGFSAQQVEAQVDLESMVKRRTTTVLVYCYSILVLSVLLTLVGVTAAFWHMAWWIGVAFVAMTAVSLGVVVIAFGRPPSQTR